jgi:hypothetical protein
MKKVRFLWIFCFIFLCSCSTISFERKVEDNIFISTSDPKIRVAVNPDFQYIGKISTARHHQKVQGSRRMLVNYNSYLFAQIDENNFIKQGVIIRLDKVKKSSWQSDLFADLKNKLISDYVDINLDRYEHYIAVKSDIFTKDEMDFIISEGMKNNASSGDNVGRLNYCGYSIPKCFMIEGFGKRAGVGNDIRTCIYYFEDLTEIDNDFSCKYWVKGEVSSDDLDRASRNLINKRKKALTIHPSIR